MFSQNSLLQNTKKTGINYDQQVFLVQTSINNIDKIYSNQPL